MKIGPELRRIREEAGLTQDDLAQRAELHRTYISMLERDVKSPTLDVFERLCQALGMSPSKMMSRIERVRK